MDRHPRYPNVLIETSRVEELIGTPGIRLVEVDLDLTVYDEGHLMGAQLWSWADQLRLPDTGQIPSREQMEKLLRASGITNSDTVVLYGDYNNWFACWAFWLMKLYGHERVFLLDGGAKKWFAEGRTVTTAPPEFTPSHYIAQEEDRSNRATVEDVMTTFFDARGAILIDARSHYEYDGRSLGPAGVRPNSAVPGHIPTAINIPWQLNCNSDGTFKAPDELKSLYDGHGVLGDRPVITYCAIGERASLTWFVLKYLLNRSDVMNYDRSMAEWSRLPNSPLVLGEAA